MGAWQEYVSDPSVNWSSLKHMATSARLYQYHQQHPVADKPAWALGRAVHTLVLEPDKFADEYAVYGGRRAGKTWKAFALENATRDILKTSDAELAKRIADAVLSHPAVAPLLDGAQVEQALRWIDHGTEIKCKGRLDIITKQGGLADLKTTRSLEWFAKKDFAAYLYHGQFAFYDWGLRSTTGNPDAPPPMVIAAETVPPYDVGVFEISPDVLLAGQNLMERLLDQLKHCLETDKWSGQYPEPTALELPRWADGVEAEQPLTMGGEEMSF